MKRSVFIITGLAISAGWLVRTIITGEGLFGFIVWNIFLATIPLLVEPVFHLLRKHARGGLRHAGNAVLSLIWLLFLPNTFYLLTDFMHLNPAVLVDRRDGNYDYSMYYSRGDGIYIFDSLLLFCAAAFGAYAGGLALYHAYAFLVRRVGRWYASIGLGVVILLTSIGVYLGRFGRWNSWQAVTHPWGILVDLADTLSRPAYRQRFITVVFTMFVFASASLLFVAYNQRTGHHTRK